MSGVALLPHNPAWAAAFEAERARIVAAVGAYLVEIEHVGSTAIPGIVAKPIVDIAATVRSFDDPFIEPLVGIGYEYVRAYEDELPNRRYFRSRARGGTGDRLFHLHVYEHRHAEYEEYLAFRDHLRAHPEAAAEYEALKRGLAATVPRERYAYGKEAFVRGVVAKARARVSGGPGRPARPR